MAEQSKNETSLLVKLDNHKNIFNLIQNGICITNERSIILYTNPAFTKITGYSAEEMLGKNPGILHSGCQDNLFYKSMWESIQSKGFWEGEIWNRRKSGEIYPEFLTISKIEHDYPGQFSYIAIFSDITFLKKDKEKKLHLAFYDPLTELPNRNLFLDRLNHLNKSKMTVFYMDLDKFKDVNDAHGHCVGDSLLKIVGKRLAGLCRSEDTIARIGGDEFAVILQSDSSRNFAMNFSERLLTSIEQPISIDGQKFKISISIGISFYPKDTNNLDELLDFADKAMYKAKKSGSRIECHRAEDSATDK